MTLSGDQLKFTSLLANFLEGTLSKSEADELCDLLRQSPEAQTFYAEYMVVHALLQWQNDTPGEDTSVSDNRAATKGKIPQFGFLGAFGGSVPFYPIVFALVFGVLGVVVLLGRMLILPASPQQSHSIPSVTSNASKSAPLASKITPVAKLTGSSRCNWSGASEMLKVGDGLSVGQLLRLDSGVAEITYNIGARVILQSPASFSVETPKSIRLVAGKLTAEIVSADARGFKVLTSDATFVDQGTEFGVEVAPDGNSRIHVFKGAVDLSLDTKPGSALPAQRLLADSGARLEGNSPRVTFVKDTGESFMRSMDQADRDEHVVAYWRFEDHPVGTLLSDTKMNTEVVCATVDSSFNGNDLFTYSDLTRPVFSDEVAESIVPQNQRVNRSCLDNTQSPKPAPTRDLYTSPSFSHASPIDIQRITPAQWTIEASVKVMELGRTQTFVGRDGAETHLNVPPRLAFQINLDGHFAIRFRDTENRVHEAIANDFVVEPERWYHVAAVSDGQELRLYVNVLDGHGYRLLATTKLPTDGSTALGSGGADAQWTVGRGKGGTGWPSQWFKGWIDEVRICDIALQPSEFLFTPQNTNETSSKEAQAFEQAAASGAESKRIN
jgi:hypothetical protein